MQPTVRTPFLSGARWAAFALCASAALVSTGAWAQATRTWVSGVGDDVNPCSRTAPCKTFAGAISKTAPNGQINVLDPAALGTVTITKPMVLAGNGTFASVLASSTNGIIINVAPTDTVVLRDLDIFGAGTGLVGVKIVQAGKVVLDNVRLQGFTESAVEVGDQAATKVFIQNSQLINNTGAINIQGANSQAYVSNTTVFGNGTVFTTVSGAKVTSFNNNRLEGNTQPGTPTDTVYER
ncbi:MAG: hypothetical protein LBI66_06070 [Burkholderiaceae bacterium]|jgi:hypothetical protein|nr:hypothetical protein [Burkholderiaceae bacterium]